MGMWRLGAMTAAAVLAAAGSNGATAAVWPGAAPCNATLQACINGTTAGGIVEVASNAVIDESLTVNKALALRAAAGYRPVLAAGRVISGTFDCGGMGQWSVSGFELRRGFISANVTAGGNCDVGIHNNRIRGDISSAAQISIVTGVLSLLTYRISGNEVDYFSDLSDGALHAAIQVLDSEGAIATAGTNGTIRDNRVIARGNTAIGVLVVTRNRTHLTNVYANQVVGGETGAIRLRLSGGGDPGMLDAAIISNAVRGFDDGNNRSNGIVVEAYDGSVEALVANNTVVNATYGLDYFAQAGVVTTGRIERNVFAHIVSRAISRAVPSPSGIVDNNNLLFDAPDTPASVSANTIFADPRFVAFDDLRLRADSPAIDQRAIASLQIDLDDRFVPAIDADGLRRFKGAPAAGDNILDLGAFEAGDASLLHVVNNALPGSDNVSDIDSPLLNGVPTALPQITQNWNPDGASGLYNDHPVSLGYGGTARWRVRQEDLLNFPNGVRFNVLVPGRGPGAYRHQPTAGNTPGAETLLTQADLDFASSNYVLTVTRDWSGSASISDLPVPFGVRFSASTWRIARLDGGGLPLNGGFLVHFQPPSFNAFRVIAGVGNTFENVMYIDNASLNFNRCARFQVTPSAAGTVNNHDIGVFYTASNGRWAVFNQDIANIPVGAEFHVLVDPAAVCQGNLFADSFE